MELEEGEYSWRTGKGFKDHLIQLELYPFQF